MPPVRMLPPRRGRTRYALFSLLLFATEILIATRLAHMPLVRGSLGDVFVVMLLYCLVLSFRNVDRLRLAGGVFLFACAIEMAQYFGLAHQLGFRRGSAASIVLGSTFQWTDILCYFVGCAAALVLDASRWLRWGQARSQCRVSVSRRGIRRPRAGRSRRILRRRPSV